MGSTENCSVFDAVRFVPGRSPFLVPQKLTRSPDQTPTRSRRSEWAGRKARCCRAGFPCRQALPCVGADAYIDPPASLAAGWLLSVTSRSQPQCRAGVHARRKSLAVSQRLAVEIPACPPVPIVAPFPGGPNHPPYSARHTGAAEPKNGVPRTPPPAPQPLPKNSLPICATLQFLPSRSFLPSERLTFSS